MPLRVAHQQSRRKYQKIDHKQQMSIDGFKMNPVASPTLFGLSQRHRIAAVSLIIPDDPKE